MLLVVRSFVVAAPTRKNSPVLTGRRREAARRIQPRSEMIDGRHVFRKRNSLTRMPVQ